MPSVLLMAAMTNVQIVGLLLFFALCFCLNQSRVVKRGFMDFFWLLLVGKAHYVSSGEGHGRQNGL